MCRIMWPMSRGSKWQFLGKMRVETLGFGFATPKRHFLALNRVFWRIFCRNRCARLGCSLSQEPKKIAESPCRGARNHACSEPKPLNRFGKKNLRGGRYPRLSYLHEFWWPSVKGFFGADGSNFPLSHRLSSSPLQHSRTTVRACDTVLGTCDCVGWLWRQQASDEHTRQAAELLRHYASGRGRSQQSWTDAEKGQHHQVKRPCSTIHDSV